jgi:ABC-type multidrug transport system ATPase subunit
LKKCENTPIFIANQKGISGGEKRRLAFGAEILTDPMILFCDEPTSGLDSFMAMSVVDSMKSLAMKGKCIICTIHQPSSEIFERFDKLCLLAEGRLAFLGSLPEAISFFQTQNLNVPYNYNPADFYIRNLAIAATDREACLERVTNICDGFAKSPLKKKIVHEIESSLNNSAQNEHLINFKKELQ